jgi:hypothetical protein
MPEIPRDKIEINSIKSSKLDFRGKQEEKNVFCSPENKNIGENQDVYISSLRNHPGEILGRSQVNSKKFNITSFSGELAQNLKNDLAYLGDNFEQVDKSDKLYNIAFEKAVKDGNPNPYKAATEIQMGFIQEMSKE